MIENANPAQEFIARIAEEKALDGAGRIMAFSSFTGDFFHIEKPHPESGRIIGFVCGAGMPFEVMDDEESLQKMEALAKGIHELCEKLGIVPYEEPKENAPSPTDETLN